MKLEITTYDYLDQGEFHYQIIRLGDKKAHVMNLRLSERSKFEDGEWVNRLEPELLGCTTHHFQKPDRYNSKCDYSPTGACSYHDVYVDTLFRPIESVLRLVLKWAARTDDLGADELIRVREEVVLPIQRLTQEYREVIPMLQKGD